MYCYLDLGICRVVLGHISTRSILLPRIRTGSLNTAKQSYLLRGLSQTHSPTYSESSKKREDGCENATNCATPDRSTQDAIVRSLSDVSPNHPAPASHLWIELNQKKTLIRRTAYFDGRRQFGPSVVIIILHNDSDELTKPILYARVTMANGEEKCMELEYWKKTGYVKLAWNDYYVNYLLRIKLEQGSVKPPLYIQMTSSLQHCYSGISLLPPMPVFNDQRERTNKFAVCTAKALFNDKRIDPQWIVHWVEFNKALGASYITILIQDISDKVFHLMRPYMEEGLVEVIDWKISVNIHEKGMWGSLQECIYRNINRAKYLALHDSDEILVPQKHRTWLEMIADLKKVDNISRYASFSFFNAFWYDIGLPVESAVDLKCPAMELPLYFQRTDRAVNPEHIHPKYMVCLDTTIAGNIHEISHWQEGYEMRLKVPIEIGQSHHFRIPIREQDYKRHDRHYDPEFMVPYVYPLMTNIRKQFCK